MLILSQTNRIMKSKIDGEDILDEYECKKCGNVLRREITFNNVTTEEPILYCPFCGEKYEEA